MKVIITNLGIRMVLILLVLLVMTACSIDYSGNVPTLIPVPIELQDRSWLTGKPCAPPCWYGMYIDESTEQDVMEVIDTLPFVVSDEVSVSNSGFTNLMSKERSISTDIKVPKIGNSFVLLRIGEGVLYQIKFSLNYPISISEVVNEIGAPDELLINPDFNTEYCDVEFFWLSQQLIVITRLDGDDWKDKCWAVGNSNPIDRELTVNYVELIHRDWLTATFTDDDEYIWPGFQD